MKQNKASLPGHIDETLDQIAKLHASHTQQAAPLQRVVNGLTAMAGQPRFVAAVPIAALLWIGANLGLSWANLRPFDPPPFHTLHLVLSFTAVNLAVLILAAQRHDNELAELRDQLTLELAILSEKKAAKTIELLEELRRDSPILKDRLDKEAQAMAESPEPEDMAEAVKDAHEKQK
jgi:uncharacterized membrane protein